MRLLVQGGSLTLNLALQILDFLLLLGKLLLLGIHFLLQIGHGGLPLLRLEDGAVDLDNSHLYHLLALNLQRTDQSKQKKRQECNDPSMLPGHDAQTPYRCLGVALHG